MCGKLSEKKGDKELPMLTETEGPDGGNVKTSEQQLHSDHRNALRWRSAFQRFHGPSKGTDHHETDLSVSAQKLLTLPQRVLEEAWRAQGL